MSYTGNLNPDDGCRQDPYTTATHTRKQKRKDGGIRAFRNDSPKLGLDMSRTPPPFTPGIQHPPIQDDQEKRIHSKSSGYLYAESLSATTSVV